MIPGSAASMLPSAEAAKLYQTNYVRNSSVIGLLWAIFTILFGIVNVIIFSQPYWVGDGVDTPQAGYFGLFHFCVGDGISRDVVCEGSFTEFAAIPSTAFKAASFFIGMSMMLIVACIACFSLFFLLGTSTVYKICGWMQALSGVCLVLGCIIYPDGWDSDEVRKMCGEQTDKYSLGACSVRWAYILAIMGILDALILSFLAFVLGNRQDGLMSEELLAESKVPVNPQHQLSGERPSSSVEERNSVEPASLPFTSTCQIPSVPYPQSPSILLAVPESSPALRWSPMHFYPNVSTDLTLAQHCIDHGRGRDCYSTEKYTDFPLPT
ncbi:LHFPL tetraspan subfamily member 3 protein-like isoform X1 [Trematomus bernacchii]|uniref:LHFPL tetraspan subfamily member 3 protein-like isoform X1 n=1 Tax=Trematomus bernacchii TaxID=40690 RepID=UPI00146D7C6E|nr:LHFPL tetraspan subfamily member 3 protein-like isoform X1 [Trematomus bernacchii]